MWMIKTREQVQHADVILWIVETVRGRTALFAITNTSRKFVNTSKLLLFLQIVRFGVQDKKQCLVNNSFL